MAGGCPSLCFLSLCEFVDSALRPQNRGHSSACGQAPAGRWGSTPHVWTRRHRRIWKEATRDHTVTTGPTAPVGCACGDSDLLSLLETLPFNTVTVDMARPLPLAHASAFHVVLWTLPILWHRLNVTRPRHGVCGLTTGIPAVGGVTRSPTSTGGWLILVQVRSQVRGSPSRSWPHPHGCASPARASGGSETDPSTPVGSQK